MTRILIAVSFFSIVLTGSARAQSTDDGSYLWPYVLYTTVGSPGATNFEGRDAAGQTLLGSIEFYDYDNARISIDASGAVTGLQVDEEGYGGTVVRAIVDGDTLQFPAYVRVLSQDYGFTFNEVVGEHVTLYYPSQVGSDDLESLVAKYDVVNLLDTGYKVQQFLLDLAPLDGARQQVTVEPEEFYDFLRCANTNMNLRLGYLIGGTAFQNCFMVPYLPGNSPRLDLMLHEFGHAFELDSETFVRGLAFAGSPIYFQGVADLMFTAVPQVVAEEPATYPLGADAKAAMEDITARKSAEAETAFDDWLAAGGLFGDITPPVIHGMVLHHREERSIEFYQRFFYILREEFEDDLADILDQVDNLGNTGEHTFFAALLSAVIKVDHFTTFEDDYHYPLDSGFFDTAFDRFTQMLDESIFTSVDDEPTGFSSASIDVFPNPVVRTATVAITLPTSGTVSIAVFDILGRQVLELSDGFRPAGRYEAVVDAVDLPAGLYLVRVEQGSVSTIAPFVLVR